MIGSAVPASADNVLQFTPAATTAGVEYNSGQCPCFRFTIQAKALGGYIETKEIIVSADALLKYEQARSMDLQQLTSRMVTAGAFDVLLREGHIGLGFKGVSFGRDSDHDYAEVLRTGFYALVNLIKNDAVRLDIRSGMDIEKLRTLMGAEAKPTTLDQAVAFQWENQSIRAEATAHVGLQPDRLLDMSAARFGVNARARTRLTTVGDFEIGAGVQASVEHDPFREALGLDMTHFVGTILFDVSWVEHENSNDD